MHRIEYEIKLSDNGRPCIDLPKDHEDKPEDKFFWIEMARYFLQTTHSRMTSPPYDQHTIDEMDRAVRLLGQIGDEMAHIMWDNMIMMGEVDLIMQKNYHISVQSFEELDRFSYSRYICNNGKLYEKKEGLKAFVIDENQLYELKKDNDDNLFWIISL